MSDLTASREGIHGNVPQVLRIASGHMYHEVVLAADVKHWSCCRNRTKIMASMPMPLAARDTDWWAVPSAPASRRRRTRSIQLDGARPTRAARTLLAIRDVNTLS